MYAPGMVFAPAPLAKHPLNRGLTGCWLGLPGHSGGPLIADLKSMSRDRAGTLTNGPTWRTVEGGFVALVLDGSNDEAVVTGGVYGAALTNTTAVVHALFPAPNAGGCLFKIGNNTGGTGAGDGYGIGIGNTSFEVAGNQILALVEGSRWLLSGAVFTQGWHSLGITWNSGGGGALWWDGRSIFTFGTSGGDAAPTTKLFLGGYSGSSGENRHFAGTCREWRVYDRTLAATEMAELHAAMALGHPHTLRRRTEESQAVMPAPVAPLGTGGTFIPALSGAGW